MSGLLDAPGPGFNPQAVGGARGTDTQHTAGVLSLFSFSSLRFSLKTQFYFQLSPYFISLFGRKNAVFGGTAEQDSKGQGERPSRTSRRHSSRWGCRFSPPWPSLPVGSSSPELLWTSRGKTGFITRSSQHLRPWDAEEEICPDFKGRVPEQLCLPHSTLTQTKPPPLPLQGEQVGSPGLIRESCLLERELNC